LLPFSLAGDCHDLTAVLLLLLCRVLPGAACFLQAENASLCSRLQEVSEQLADREAELKNRLGLNELQLKEQIVYNVSASGCNKWLHDS
jgi:hypothetical protein